MTRIARHGPKYSKPTRTRGVSVGAALFLAGLALMVFETVYQPLLGGELVLRTGPHDPQAVPATTIPDGERFAFHQKSKSGAVPLVLPLTLEPSDGPISVVSQNWSWQFDTRFGPGLMESTPERFTYATAERETLRRSKRGGPAKARINLPGMDGEYLQQGLYDLEASKRYYVLLPQDGGRADQTYRVWVRKHVPGESLQRFLLSMVLLAAGIGLVLWFLRGVKRSGMASGPADVT